MMAAIVAYREVAPLLSGEHFSVDRTLVKAWASMKSFRPKARDTAPDDDPGSPPGSDASAKDHPEQTQTETDPQNETDQMTRKTRQSRNADVDFRGEKRSNATHASPIDPDARRYNQSRVTWATLCFIGQALMENRSGLIVRRDQTQVDGHTERRAALNVFQRHPPD